MVFSSVEFLFAFLVLTLGLYYLAPRPLRNGVLFLASLLFYFWGEKLYTLIMLLSTAIDFTHGMIVEKAKEAGKDRLAKGAVLSSVLMNLGLLAFFKYANLFTASLRALGLLWVPATNIHLPIGISFYTFQTMSYTIDVYRGDAKAKKNIVTFGTFVTLFPQLIAGPIVRYKDIDEQLDNRKETGKAFADGVRRFILGLSKKVLLANSCGALWEQISGAGWENLTCGAAWLGALAYTFQIYFDFSGYSDMAIGLGKMFGFSFPENFNYPYIAVSIRDFWKRWHITLSTWFRDYLYIPLGGSRVSPWRAEINLLIVWAATGFWHGASWTFLLWGLYYFLLLTLERKLSQPLDRLPKVLRRSGTFLLVLFGWVLFALEDLPSVGKWFAAMFGGGVAGLWSPATGYWLGNSLLILLLSALAATPLFRILRDKLRARFACPVLYATTDLLPLLAGLVLSVASIVAGSYNPFLYFRF